MIFISYHKIIFHLIFHMYQISAILLSFLDVQNKFSNQQIHIHPL